MPVERIAWFGARVADVDATARRLREVADLPRLPVDQHSEVLSIGDNCLVLSPDHPFDDAPGRYEVAPNRFTEVALRVTSLASARASLLEHRVLISWENPVTGEFRSDPATSGDVPLLWTDRDLVGDPRGPLAANG